MGAVFYDNISLESLFNWFFWYMMWCNLRDVCWGRYCPTIVAWNHSCPSSWTDQLLGQNICSASFPMFCLVLLHCGSLQRPLSFRCQQSSFPCTFVVIVHYCACYLLFFVRCWILVHARSVFLVFLLPFSCMHRAVTWGLLVHLHGMGHNQHDSWTSTHFGTLLDVATSCLPNLIITHIHHLIWVTIVVVWRQTLTHLPARVMSWIFLTCHVVYVCCIHLHVFGCVASMSRCPCMLYACIHVAYSCLCFLNGHTRFFVCI